MCTADADPSAAASRLVVMLFASSSAALCAEKTAREEGIVVKLILTPRRFSASCAICLRFSQTAQNRLEAAMRDRGFSHEGVHLLVDEERSPPTGTNPTPSAE